MIYRDAHGRFRKRTDEERWPDPRERRLVQESRAMFLSIGHLYAKVALENLRDISFVSGRIW